jgi:hypothetical protein
MRELLSVPTRVASALRSGLSWWLYGERIMSTSSGASDLQQALSRTLHEHWLPFLITDWTLGFHEAEGVT